MRNSILSIILILATVYAMPLAAQSAPEFQAPSKGELKQLKKRENAELRMVRAGDGKGYVTLSPAERERIETMTSGQVLQVQKLGEFKAGRHAHIHWGVWVAIPCGAVCTVVLIVWLILILI